MKQRILAIASICLALASVAEADFNVSTFEDVGLSKPNSYFNAAPNLTDPTFSKSGSFVSGGNAFGNQYTYVNQYGGYGFWNGWSISNQTNTTYVDQATTPDYNFEYTSVTGSGSRGSSTYAVANTEGNGVPPVSIVNLAPGSSPISVDITNTAYDYDSIKYGDGFAKPFVTGNYLLLTIDGYDSSNGTGAKVGEVAFYLANYLNPDATQQYIVDTWKTLDLGSLQGSRSLVFGLQSNDVNQYGVAIPYEFALDNLSAGQAIVPEPSSLLLCLGGIGLASLSFRRVRVRPGHISGSIENQR